MAAHLGSPMLDGEPLSPELVLVCPELAGRARALLPDRPELWTRRDDPLASTSAAFESVDSPDLHLKPDDHDATQGRLDELTSLVDRIAGDWEKVDGRLAQLERAVARMEAALAVAATPPAPWLDADARTEEEGPLPSPAGAEREAGSRTGLVGTLVLVASVMAGMVAVELLPSLGERPRLAVVSEGAVPTVGDPAGQPSGDSRASTTAEATGETAAPTPRRTAPTRSTTATIEPPDEPGPTTMPRLSSPTSPPSPTTTAPPPAQTGAGGPSRTAPAPPPPRTTAPRDFTPARVFLWPAADGATFYAVTFLRDGSTFYSARVSRPRLALPESITFRPGSYRWIVRPGTAGQPLRSPIVDSTFTVEPS